MSSQTKTALPGIPLVESPFFDEIFSPANLPNEVIRVARDLHDRGFAIIDFPDPDFDGRAEAIKSALHETEHWETSESGERRWTPNLTGRRFQDAWKSNADVKAIAVNERILGLLSSLYGRRAWPFQTLNFPVGTQQHYHSDAFHFSSFPERFMCGVWVALEDVGPDQGPLEYYPGSHKWPIYTNEHLGRYQDNRPTTQTVFHEAWESLVRNSGIEREIFTPRKGQALIWAANLLHGGVVHNDKTRTRWSQVTHYYFDDCAYYTPMMSDPFRGLIKFRSPIDITTGAIVPNKPHGVPIPQGFVIAAQLGLSNFGVTAEQFDSAAYLEANPDVGAAGVDAWTHWQEHGRNEGRPLRR